MRRFLTSTTTVLERPWLKLCLTLPVSTVRLRPSGGRVPSFGFSVWSAILFLRQIFFSRAGPQGGFSAFQTSIGASKSPPPGKRVSNTRSGGGIGQGDMYHILAPKCHGQDSAPLGEYHPLRLAAADPPGLVELAAPVLAGVGGVEQQTRPCRRGPRHLDLVGAVDEVAGARLHAEAVERGLAQRLLGALAKVGGDVQVVGLERALQRGLKLALGVGGIELVPARRRSRRRGPGRGRGRRARRLPSGPSASRISSSFVPLRRVRTQVRSGTCAFRSSVSAVAGIIRDVRIGGLLLGGLPARLLRPRTSGRGRP